MSNLKVLPSSNRSMCRQKQCSECVALQQIRNVATKKKHLDFVADKSSKRRLKIMLQFKKTRHKDTSKEKARIQQEYSKHIMQKNSLE